MELRQMLTKAFAAGYPKEAAAAIESRPAEEAARIIRALPPEIAAEVVRSMEAGSAANSLERLEAETAAAIITNLSAVAALALLRRMNKSMRRAVIAVLPADRARGLESALRFPEGTAGALMNPGAVALPGDLTVAEALKTVRRAGEHIEFDLHVVDRENRLAGALNLRQLLQADNKARIDTIMRPAAHLIYADNGYPLVERNPGWAEVMSLPVVDRRKYFLGALSYKTLKNIERDRQRSDKIRNVETSDALGGLFWVGVGAVFDAVASTVSFLPPTAASSNTNHDSKEPDHE